MWRIAKIVAAVVLAALALITAIIADAFGHGPYTTWNNNRCLRLDEEAQLVGKPESEIAAVLGPPSYIWVNDESERRITYNDDPLGLMAGIFQVHCRDGIVKGLEPFDD